MKNFERSLEREITQKSVLPAALALSFLAACGSSEDPSAARIRDISDMSIDSGMIDLNDLGITDQEMDSGFNNPDNGGLEDAGPDMRVEEDMNVSDMGSDTDMGPSCNPNTPEEVTDLIRRSFIYKVPTNPVRGSNSAPITTTTDNPNFILQVGDSATNCEITNIFYGPNDPNFTKDLTIGQDCVDTDLKKALQLEEGRLSAGQARLHGGLWIYQGDSDLELTHYPNPSIDNESLITGDADAFVKLNTTTRELEYKTENLENAITLSGMCVENLQEISREMTNTLSTYKSDTGL